MAGGVEGVGKIDRRKKKPRPPHEYALLEIFCHVLKTYLYVAVVRPQQFCAMSLLQKKVRKIMRKKKIAPPKKYAKKSWPPHNNRSQDFRPPTSSSPSPPTPGHK